MVSLFSKGCTKLEYLNVSWCTQISSHGLKLLAQGCQNLLVFIAEGCSLVRKVNTNTGHNINRDYTWGWCSSLKTNLYLQITDEGIYHLTKSCIKLRSIKLKTCEVIILHCLRTKLSYQNIYNFVSSLLNLVWLISVEHQRWCNQGHQWTL